ncbi:AraC family transcriptional regulator [Herbaspirillum robiniae]|uniref:AraC family transcriptional regulator n=1 Tax=Herbaspirillum robiniae TaxID=2014887 RepID=A0ABX2M0A6_9BURK|nr:AraC family transcriptional regulator [Herbaspirillum robiniae]NUU03404.1 AraC family transcriptional regulator [Herbaspirillum robiniae]
MPSSMHFWRDPALPFLEGRRATGSLSCYAPHTHPTFSIGIVDAGRSVFTLAASSMPIAPGDVVLVRAGDVHCCNPEDLQSWSYRMFHLDLPWLEALLSESPATAGLARAMRSQVIRSEQAVRLLDRMSTALDGRAGDKEAEVITCLHELMLLCAEAAGSVAQAHSYEDQPGDAGLRRAYDYLQAHCRQTVAIDTLAQVAGTGRYQLIRQFRRRYGLTPHALQLDMKINQARALLQQGASATDAAYDTGFADQSHFHRVFKSRVAATPLQYRKA